MICLYTPLPGRRMQGLGRYGPAPSSGRRGDDQRPDPADGEKLPMTLRSEQDSAGLIAGKGGLRDRNAPRRTKWKRRFETSPSAPFSLLDTPNFSPIIASIRRTVQRSIGPISDRASPPGGPKGLLDQLDGRSRGDGQKERAMRGIESGCCTRC